MINKRGEMMQTIYVLGTVLIVAVIIFVAALGLPILKSATDELFPVVRDIGVVSDGVNITEYANYALNPLESIINNYQVICMVGYMVGIIWIFSMAFIFRNSLSGWTIGFFLACVLLIITITILMSNTYEVYYNAGDDLALALHDASTLSFLALYSPTIMTIISFIAGIIMMTGGSRGYYG